MTAAQQIEEKFASGEFTYKTAREIARLLGVTQKSEREAVNRVLRSLEEEGAIVRDEKNRYVLPAALGLYKGVLRGNERGFAFLVREEGDLFIPHRSLHGAMHGDTVFARCVGGERGDEGEVYSIVSRGYSEIVGTYFKEKKGGYVQPDERRFFNDVRVAGSKVRAYSGEKVLIKILNYPEGGEPVGEITEVLGQSGDLSCEEDAIIRSKNLAEEFPHKVLAEAKRVSAEKVEVGGGGISATA